MTGLLPLLRKEALEALRTHKVVVAWVLYLLVGLASPLLARLTPEILAMLPEEQLGGVELLITQDPTLDDALVQYLKNFTMLPLLAVLLAMGAVAGEKRQNTLAMLLSKPLSRRALLGAKLGIQAAIHGVGTVLAAGACGLYATILFGGLYWPVFLLANGLLLLGQWFFLAVTLLGSVATRSPGAAAGAGIGVYLVALGLMGLPALSRYTPVGLFTAANDLALGREILLLPVTLGIAIGSTILCLVLADRLFARQEIA